MATQQRLICSSAALQEKGTGVRFALPELGAHVSGFVLRYDGNVHAYINQCAHLPVELDWNEGEFLSRDQQHLICATHGALYQPQTGICVMGPCQGKALRKLEVTEQDQQVFINLSSLDQKV